MVTSQTAVLQTELEAINLDTLQLRASGDLICALGGGWKYFARAQNSKVMDRQNRGKQRWARPMERRKSAARSLGAHNERDLIQSPRRMQFAG